MTTNVIEVYEIFKELGLKEDKAKKVVDILTESAKEGVATREDIYKFREEFKEDIHRLENEILNLDKKIDRSMYILIIVLILLNGDKVLQFLSLFVK